MEGLASPNTVVISQATSRLVHDAFALGALGLAEAEELMEQHG